MVLEYASIAYLEIVPLIVEGPDSLRDVVEGCESSCRVEEIVDYTYTRLGQILILRVTSVAPSI